MSIVSPTPLIYPMSFGIGYAVASLAMSANALGRFVVDVPEYVLADKWGWRLLILAGTLVITTMTLSNANAPYFSLFLVFRFLQDVGSSTWMTSRQALLVDRGE